MAQIAPGDLWIVSAGVLPIVIVPHHLVPLTVYVVPALYRAGVGATCCAMAQTNPASSRAAATQPFLAFTPRLDRCENREHKHTRAFHACVRMPGATLWDQQLIGSGKGLGELGFGSEMREALRQRSELLVDRGWVSDANSA